MIDGYHGDHLYQEDQFEVAEVELGDVDQNYDQGDEIQQEVGLDVVVHDLAVAGRESAFDHHSDPVSHSQEVDHEDD